MTRAEVYRALARRYGYTPAEIADMSPAQRMFMLDDTTGGDDADPIRRTLDFRTRAEYDEWLRSRK